MKEQHATNVFVCIEKMRSLFIIFRTISQVKRFGRNTFVAYLHNVLLLPYNLTLGFSLQLNKYNEYQFWYQKMVYFFLTDEWYYKHIFLKNYYNFIIQRVFVPTKFIIFTNGMQEKSTKRKRDSHGYEAVKKKCDLCANLLRRSVESISWMWYASSLLYI